MIINKASESFFTNGPLYKGMNTFCFVYRFKPKKIEYWRPSLGNLWRVLKSRVQWWSVHWVMVPSAWIFHSHVESMPIIVEEEESLAQGLELTCNTIFRTLHGCNSIIALSKIYLISLSIISVIYMFIPFVFFIVECYLTLVSFLVIFKKTSKTGNLTLLLCDVHHLENDIFKELLIIMFCLAGFSLRIMVIFRTRKAVNCINKLQLKSF